MMIFRSPISERAAMMTPIMKIPYLMAIISVSIRINMLACHVTVYVY